MDIRYTITKWLALLIGIEACLVMAGWIFGVDALTRILSDGINMKFPTALAFFFSAIGLYYIARSVQDNYEPSLVVLPGIALAIFLVMATLLASDLSGGQTGIENLFVAAQSPVNAAGSGMPSLPTTVSFMLFGFASIVSIFPGSKNRKKLMFFGYLILIIGFAAVVGYVLHVPVLYYQFTDSSVPMAFNTALTFVVLSCGLIIVSTATTADETE